MRVRDVILYGLAFEGVLNLWGKTTGLDIKNTWLVVLLLGVLTVFAFLEKHKDSN